MPINLLSAKNVNWGMLRRSKSLAESYLHAKRLEAVRQTVPAGAFSQQRESHSELDEALERYREWKQPSSPSDQSPDPNKQRTSVNSLAATYTRQTIVPRINPSSLQKAINDFRSFATIAEGRVKSYLPAENELGGREQGTQPVLANNLKQILPAAAFGEWLKRGNEPLTHRWLAVLEKAAENNAVFDEATMGELQAWSATHPQAALDLVQQSSLHGRVRWTLLDVLAVNPTERLQRILVDLLDQSDDLWLLTGVLTVLRFMPTPAHDGELRRKLRLRLTGLQQPREDFRDRRGNAWKSEVGSKAISEMIMLFGDLAQPTDITFLGSFALQDHPSQPRVNALHALTQTVSRYASAAEADDFFRGRQVELIAFGEWLAAGRQNDRDKGVLLLSWMELLVARVGPETEWLVHLITKWPSQARTARVRLRDAWAILESRGDREWLTAQENDYKRWLERISLIVPAREVMPPLK